ncbi:hypothetical protein ES708_09201 [subsurface metagenome]
MNNQNDFFAKMCKEALEELASGKKSWKEIETNTLFLAAFGILYNSLMHKLARPLRWLAGCAVAAVLTYIVSVILSRL